MNLYVNGRNINIEFTPVSNYYAGKKGSRYVTANEALQNAIEKDYRFGYSIFIEDEDGKLVTSIEETAPVAKVVREKKHIAVAGFADAKSWLVDNLDIKSSTIRSKAQAIEIAEAHDIVFDGLI